MTLFPGARAAGPTLDQPLEILAACHERIESQLATLERLMPHVASHGADRAAAGAARAVLRYFDIAGVNHHEDEEQDLFPMLLGRGPADTGALLERLRADHAAMRSAWASLRPGLAGIAEGAAAAPEAGAVKAFVLLYRDHIRLETQRLLPLAERVLARDDLAALSARMVLRRSPPKNVV